MTTFMDIETIKALEGSIAKWQGIANGALKDEGAGNCPLCEKFLGDDCVGCPVRKHTGDSSCYGSPYDLWVVFGPVANGGYGRAATNWFTRWLARLEVRFLKSILSIEKRHEPSPYHDQT